VRGKRIIFNNVGWPGLRITKSWLSIANQKKFRLFFIAGFIVSTQYQCLELWRRSLVASVRADTPDLSARQMALLLSVYMGVEPHTVRGLAVLLKISKPAVSRALDRLGELGYIRRERDDIDHRNVFVRQTALGSAFLANMGSLIARAALEVAALPAKDLDFVLETTIASPALPSVAAWGEVAA
jgi:DNA-binding MarR family transcriptional regulator